MLLCALNDDHEVNSSNSDLEFERQIRLKQDEIEKLQGDLNAAKVCEEAKDSDMVDSKQKFEKYIADYARQVINVISMNCIYDYS